MKRGRALVLAAALAVALPLVLVAKPAGAQIHWDASAQAGVMKRFLGDKPSGGRDAGFGPAAQLTGHVALLPLVRLGGYFGHDISPMLGDASARDLTWGGLRAKIMSPWPRGSFRAWLFVGFGYSGVYQRSTTIADTVVHGAGGSYFEVPYGIGASYKLRKPWELCAEVGGRSGFGFTGSAYEDPGLRVTSPGRADANAPPLGKDTFAIGLTVGVLVDL